MVREAQRLLEDALGREAEAQRLLLEGERERAVPILEQVADLYRRSWEAAPPRSFGRLVGMLKAAVLAGSGASAAAYVRQALAGSADSPTAWYALGLAALVEDDDRLAAEAAGGMRAGSEAFARTADALGALAAHDEAAYRTALRAVVADFEAREQHLTGVPIADTALMLERLAARRGLSGDVESALLP